MKLLAQIIELAIEQCYDRAVIDWHPEDGIPERFQAECEIEPNYFNHDIFVFMLSVFMIIDLDHMECWHSSKLEVEA